MLNKDVVVFSTENYAKEDSVKSIECRRREWGGKLIVKGESTEAKRRETIFMQC